MLEFDVVQYPDMTSEAGSYLKKVKLLRVTKTLGQKSVILKSHTIDNKIAKSLKSSPREVPKRSSTERQDKKDTANQDQRSSAGRAGAWKAEPHSFTTQKKEIASQGAQRGRERQRLQETEDPSQSSKAFVRHL
ncbi:hypothetical protein NPIL_246921 [Nephila pilipes]|uniref:Uncharacterized protein n=1 Tax=Nephila pilipes TaxID=299642 RepID=A0A8X6P0G1_NEPPI|nr:hypothetical protein NPIL_246921 [Nephila pilipes]